MAVFIVLNSAYLSTVTNLAGKAALPPIDTCRILNESGSLASDVSSTGTCFVINANDITLDCNGYKVQYATVISGRGVEASDKTGLTVKNCIFEAHNVNATNNQAIKFTRTNNSLALANMIYTNGTTNNYGIYITTRSYSNSVINNTVYTNGTGGSNLGITLRSTFENNTVHNNTIYTQGSGSANNGIDLGSSGYKNNITQNVVYTNGTLSNVGILLTNSVNNSIVSNNTIYTNGTSNQNKGIQLNTRSSNNRITNNTIRTNGVSNNEGINLRIGSDNNTIEDNNITTSGGGKNYGIFINIGFGNNITNNFIIANGTNTNYGIYLFTHSNYTTVLNNTIIADGNETSNNVIQVGNSFVNEILNNTVKALGPSPTGVRITTKSSGNKVTNNVIDVYGTSGSAKGVLLGGDNVENNTIDRNNITVNGNESTSNNWGISITQTGFGNNVTNNIISTNGTARNFGIFSGTQHTFILNNTVQTNGTGQENPGIDIGSSGNFNQIINNTIKTGGTNHAYGIRIGSTHNNTAEGNNISTQGTGNQNQGIRITSGGTNNAIVNNIIITNGTGLSHGIFLINYVNNSFVANNTIVVGGGSSSRGIYLSTHSYNNTFVNNTIFHASVQTALRVERYSETNIFYDNILGSGTNYAIEIIESNNTVFSNVLLENRPLWILVNDAATNASFYNITFSASNSTMRFGEINFPSFYLDTPANVSTENLNISFARVFLNSSNLTQMNVTSFITLNLTNSGMTNPKVYVSYDDDNLSLCPETKCSNITFVDDIITFSAQGWTTYVAKEESIPSPEPSPPAPPPSGGGGGSGGGGSGGGGSNYAAPSCPSNISSKDKTVTIIFSKILSNKRYNATLNSNLSVKWIEFLSSGSLNCESITIEGFDYRPSYTSLNLPGELTAYQYLKTTTKSNAFSEAAIKFAVDKKWISDNDIEGISFYCFYNNTWTGLPTSFSGENSIEILYDSVAAKFMECAIAGIKKIAEPQKPEQIYECGNKLCESGETEDSCPVDCLIVQQEEGEEPASISWFWIIPILLLTAAIVMLFLIFYFRRKKHDQPDRLH